jgi:acyl carrier protein
MSGTTQAELLEKVRIAFQCAFNVDPRSISIDTVPADVSHWDSMGHVTLAGCLEQTFGLTLDVDDVMAMENVKEICRVLHSKLAEL